MANGIIVIDKPQDWTSMDVCAKLRGMFHEKRVGHAGTLDPMATGILPVFVGRATRGVEYAAASDKEYIARIRLGVITNTQDITGKTLETRPVTVGKAELEQALRTFRGEIQQFPPMYSAIKINGKKLYELARKGQEVERKPRSVVIHTLELLQGPPFHWSQDEHEYFLRIVCSKGTYIRSLCHDLGELLGCGGTMSALRRTMACGWTQKDALTLEELQEAVDRGEAEQFLKPVAQLFVHLPVLTVKGKNEIKVRNGVQFPFPNVAPGQYRVYGENGDFLMLGQVTDGKLLTVKSFFEV